MSKTMEEKILKLKSTWERLLKIRRLPLNQGKLSNG